MKFKSNVEDETLTKKPRKKLEIKKIKIKLKKNNI
jgi:hypothetical protein